MTEDDSEAGDSQEEEANPSEREAINEYDFPDQLLEDGRQRGLSKNDRRFLVTGKTRKGEPSENVRINTRTRIRKRIRETIVDFWLISEYLDDYDRELLFRDGELMENWEFQEGIKNAMQLFYLGLEDSDTDLMDFETAIKSAVHDAERERHEGPTIVETELDVDVSEPLRVQEAYEKYQNGAPLEPIEVGALLTTGRVRDPDEVARLAQHARGHGLFESSISPLLASQMAVAGDDDDSERVFSTVAHLPEDEITTGPNEELSDPHIKSTDILGWESPDPGSRPADISDLSNADTEPADGDGNDSADGEDKDTDGVDDGGHSDDKPDASR